MYLTNTKKECIKNLTKSFQVWKTVYNFLGIYELQPNKHSQLASQLKLIGDNMGIFHYL